MKLGLFEPLKFNNIEYISSPEISKAPHPRGLFSEEIWSPGGDERHTKVAGIDLRNCGIFIQPQIMYELKSSQRILYDAVLGTSIDLKDTKFIKTNDSDIYGLYVLKYLYDNLEELKSKNILNSRISTILTLYTFEECICSSFWVLPPALRDIQILDGRATSTHKVNEYYQYLIKHSNNTLIDSKALLKPGFDMSSFIKWESIQNVLILIHDEIGKNKVAGKTKHARENVLGKRVDFSARAVAAVDPNLSLNEIKVPYRILAKLYEPFIGHYVFKYEYVKNELSKLSREIITEVSFSKLMTDLKNGLVNPGIYKLICKIIDEKIVGNYPIIMKRDPSLHRASLQAFDFTGTDDNVIYVSPLVTDGFNLDFDGDKVALYVPLSKEAQINVKSRMTKQRVNPGSGKLLTESKQDVSLGVYLLTKPSNEATIQSRYGDVDPFVEINSKYGVKPANIYVKINYSGAKGKQVITYGQLLFNACLPLKYKLVTEPVTGSVLNKILYEILYEFGEPQVTKTIDNITKLAGRIISEYPITISLDELNIPKEITNHAKKIFAENSYKEAQKLINTEIMPKVKKWMQSVDSGLYMMIESKARGGWGDVEQMLIAKGYTADGEGKITNEPIISSLVEGLNPYELLKLGSPAAKGSSDRSLNTATTGYLERILVFGLNSVVVKEKDCKTGETIKVQINSVSDAALHLYARSKQLGIIEPKHYESMVGKEFNFYSPITCESKSGVCQKCYGDFNRVLKSNNVGINAALSLGERGSQLIMRTFHTGGRAEGSDSEVEIVPNGSKGLTQHGGKIYINKGNLKIYLDSNICEFIYSEESLLIKGGVFKYLNVDITDPEEEIINLNELGEPVGLELKLSDNIIIDTLENGVIEVQIAKNSEYFNIVYMTQDMSQTIKYIQSILTGKNVKDHNDLYDKLINIYGGHGILSKHVEVLVSQMNRSKDNHYQLWRRNKSSAGELISIRNIPFKESVAASLTYENINKAIEQGLISSKVNAGNTNTPLDQIISGKIQGS